MGSLGATFPAILASRAGRNAAHASKSGAACELAMRALTYYDEQSEERHARARADAERAAEIEPASAFVQGVLAFMYLDEFRLGFSPKPGSLDRAMAAARRAVDLDRDSEMARSALAMVAFARGDYELFRKECDAVIALNPNAADLVAECGEKLVQMGLVDLGEPLMRRAAALNPDYPSWYHYVFALIHFDRGEYSTGLAEVSKVDEPRCFAHWVYRAVFYAALNRREEAEEAIGQLLRLDQSWTVARFAENRRSRWHWPQQRLDRWLELLRESGLPEGTPVN